MVLLCTTVRIGPTAIRTENNREIVLTLHIFKVMWWEHCGGPIRRNDVTALRKNSGAPASLRSTVSNYCYNFYCILVTWHLHTCDLKVTSVLTEHIWPQSWTRSGRQTALLMALTYIYVCAHYTLRSVFLHTHTYTQTAVRHHRDHTKRSFRESPLPPALLTV